VLLGVDKDDADIQGLKSADSFAQAWQEQPLYVPKNIRLGILEKRQRIRTEFTGKII